MITKLLLMILWCASNRTYFSSHWKHCFTYPNIQLSESVTKGVQMIEGLLYNHALFYYRSLIVEGLWFKREEMKYWEQLTLNFMTEESDDMSDSNTIIEHKLTWRSQGMQHIDMDAPSF